MATNLEKIFSITFNRPGRIIEVIKNAFLDLKYGGRYLGISLDNANQEFGSTNTASTEYYVFEAIFKHINLTSNDVVVDVGCGNARLFNFLLSKGHKNKMIGVEINEAVASKTSKRLEKYSNQVDILVGDVCGKEFPENGTIFYLFNPFNRALVEKFANQVLTYRGSIGSCLFRPIIIYHNACHLDVFEDNKIYKIDNLGVMNHHETVVISLR